MKKRIFSIGFILMVLVLLVSCGSKEFTVTYDVNGGTPAIEKVKVKEGTFLEIPNQPTKEGFNFDFWQEKSSGDKWDFGKKKVTKDITLVAQWKEAPPTTYQVTFFTVGGTPQPEAMTVNEGDKVTRPTDPTKADHEFLGWYIVDTNILYDFDEVVTEDLSLAAKWLKIEHVTINYVVEGELEAPEPETILKGEKATKPADPVKDGYEFLGWYLGENLFNFADEVLTDITLTARFEKIIIKYTVTFDTTFENLEVQEQIIGENEVLTEPDKPEYPGYKFLGWYLDDVEYDFSSVVTKDLTLVAKWQEEHVVTYILDLEDNEEYTRVIVLDGEKVAKPEVDPKKDFMIFLGWQLDGVDFDFDSAVTGDLILVANWEEEPYVAAAYIGDKDYRSIGLALEEAVEGDVILIVGMTHDKDFEVNVNNITFKPYDTETVTITAKITLAVGLNGVTFDGLEFTNNAEIHAPGEIDNFVFTNNKVYDSTLDPSEFLPNNRRDVNAFIRLYTLAGTNIVGNVTITNNEFKNIASDTISLARTSIGKEIIVEDNIFHNIGNSSIRFDGGYNNGTYNLNNNTFKNDEGVVSMASIIFRAYSSSEGQVQTINVLNNEFINVGSKELAFDPESGYPGSAVIAFSTYNEYETNITIKNNIFTDTTNTIHIRNKRGNHTLLTTVINNNVFNDGEGYYLYESDYDTARGETDFNLNKFVIAGVTVANPADIADKVINNQNYDNIIIDAEYVTVTFDVDGGLPAPESQNVIKGEKAIKPEVDPEKALFNFLGWYLDDVEYDFNSEVTEDLILVAKWEEKPPVVAAYIGETEYLSIPLALEAAVEGDVILIAETTHNLDFTVSINNLTFKPYNEDKPVISAKITLVAGLNGVTFDGLEFTNNAEIHAPGNIDNFVFTNNKVYDSTIVQDDYLPRNRVDVNAFIRLYTSSGANVVGNVTITNNEFKNIPAVVVSLARTSVGKEVVIEDNIFHNIGNGSIRFDGGYNNGTYNLNDNIFKNDEGVVSMSSIVFRSYSSSAGEVQTINVLNNEFINVGSSELAITDESLHPGTAVIAFSTYNENETNITINNNIFTKTTNTIHLRNSRNDHTLLTTVINNNVFNDGEGYYLYETHYDVTRGETDFNLNKFVVGGVTITDPLELAEKIINNENYENIVTE